MKYIARDGVWELLPAEEYIPPQDKYEYQRLPEKSLSMKTLRAVYDKVRTSLEKGEFKLPKDQFLDFYTPEDESDSSIAFRYAMSVLGFDKDLRGFLPKPDLEDFDPLLVANRIVGNE